MGTENALLFFVPPSILATPVVPHRRNVLDRDKTMGAMTAAMLVGRVGLEPTTLCLKGRYSTN